MSSYIRLKLVTSSEYHLWNDALHARTLARETNSDWNRGTYVRWTITTAWTVLEMCCRDALNDQSIGNRFKDDIKKVISENQLNPINWGEGLWQEVLELKELRRKYTHIDIAQNQLWAEEKVADESIELVRKAVKNIYHIANKPVPKWIDDDKNEGWQ